MACVSLKIGAVAAGMRRQDTPFPTHGLRGAEPELSVESLKQQLCDKDDEITALRVRLRQGKALPVEKH